MKKIISLLLLTAFIFTFAACGTNDAQDKEIPKADKYSWEMNYINKMNGEVVAIDKDGKSSFTHGAKIEMTAALRKGGIKIEDVTNGKTYEGEYIESGLTPETREYKFTVDGIEGYGFCAVKTLFDGETYYETLVLIMQLGEYSLTFEAVKK